MGAITDEHAGVIQFTSGPPTIHVFCASFLANPIMVKGIDCQDSGTSQICGRHHEYDIHVLQCPQFQSLTKPFGETTP